jgi:hypothetical protein
MMALPFAFPGIMSDIGKIKGVAFFEFLAWYERRYGARLVEAAIRTVEERYGEGLDPTRTGFGVLASRWYPAGLVHDLLDQLVQVRAPAELEAMAVDAAEYIMGRTLRGVYRAVFSMFGTPDRYARHIDKLWSMHYDTGRILVDDTKPLFHRVKYSGWKGHHSFICRMNMASSLALYGAMGCREVKYERIGCVSDGASHCENVVRWMK